MDTPQPEPEQTSTQTPNERLWTADGLARYIGCSVREIRNLQPAGMTVSSSTPKSALAALVSGFFITLMSSRSQPR